MSQLMPLVLRFNINVSGLSINPHGNCGNYLNNQYIKLAKKPKSGVPGDLPTKIVTEFAPEIAAPAFKIFKSILVRHRSMLMKTK